MKQHAIEGDYKSWVSNALRQSQLFSKLDPQTSEKVMGMARLFEAQAGEVVIKERDPSDSFALVLMGEMIVLGADETSGTNIEIARVRPVECVGEMGLLSGSPRSATVQAAKQSYLVYFDKRAFDHLMDRLPGFARRLSRVVASRLVQTSRRVAMPELGREELKVPDQALVKLLPPDLIRDHRVLPLSSDGSTLTIGYVDRPQKPLLDLVARHIEGRPTRNVRIAARDFDDLLDAIGLQKKAESLASAAAPASGSGVDNTAQLAELTKAIAAGAAGGAAATSAKAKARPVKRRSQTSIVARAEQLKRIEPLLRMMIDRGASDLHLSAGQEPRWRVDGNMVHIPDVGVPAEHEVYDLLEHLMGDAAMEEFAEYSDCDFAFAVEGLARFRANMYRDQHGVGVVFRMVPMEVPSMDQIGLPKGAQRLTELNQGLILVCGPTGSGKSTTLASMINFINQSRRSHILTIEDPIEFNFKSDLCKVTQREIGKSAATFHRAMRAALREDPDIVLVGELRDLETMGLAMETAQTGHLVLSTLHTNSAISTINRIIDMFPVEQHGQVRSSLAESLKGVINQTLCRRRGGGRVAAFEILVGSAAVSNCIRTGKNTQIATIMSTNKKAGNLTMNEDLDRLVKSGIIDPNEALAKSNDRKDMRGRLGM